ncbi:carbohydrate-binding family 9-like protein [Fibrobacterota bacterium]
MAIDGRQREKTMSLKVTKLAEAPLINASWDKPPWQEIQPELIGNYMGTKPDHFPETLVKIAYDEETLYLIFRVEDRYVRAVTAHHQGDVYKDSCVEFFFAPGTDVDKGYFNLEMNCAGTMCFHFQKAPYDGIVKIRENEYRQIETAHSLSGMISTEMPEPVTWTVEYRLPMAILENYRTLVKPAPGVIWRANFYKCADETSHPHWLTWSSVAFPAPNFHLPQFFGLLEFN